MRQGCMYRPFWDTSTPVWSFKWLGKKFFSGMTYKKNRLEFRIWDNYIEVQAVKHDPQIPGMIGVSLWLRLCLLADVRDLVKEMVVISSETGFKRCLGIPVINELEEIIVE